MANEKSIYDLAVSMVKKSAGNKILVSEVNTGTSFRFNVKDRLCKVVRTKKALKLECNVLLSESLVKSLNEDKSILSVEFMTDEEAKRKKYGTCRYIVNAIDTSRIDEIIKDMITTYNK